VNLQHVDGWLDTFTLHFDVVDVAPELHLEHCRATGEARLGPGLEENLGAPAHASVVGRVVAEERGLRCHGHLRHGLVNVNPILKYGLVEHGLERELSVRVARSRGRVHAQGAERGVIRPWWSEAAVYVHGAGVVPAPAQGEPPPIRHHACAETCLSVHMLNHTVNV